ncbi:hypothetical protein SAMN05192574_110122 [Mucilaginibacter gossypiicola]|uniref:Fibronectin type-III domain-containing protein n=1 Tax=Mucilaginibacter gossypiicola TaxID=551995 RepID=A0A1H8RF15_9SPHI|nr:hypothetical protein [Mucilaginibacter gossypiicola]SEO64922.1 hypothetical protein SAMN05192574_110122 [Mucilaginibacter gossypiicola]
MKRTIFSILSFVILTGCGGKKNDPITPVLGKPTLLTPAQNEVCTQGAVISVSESTVTLKWSAATNATSYDINIKNLADGTNTTQTTANTQFDVTLKRNTPYSWSVISKAANSSTTPQSDTWKFYNSGPGTVNYAPFPAEITAPAMNQAVTVTNGKIALSWTGNDVDNDIANYDVYLSDSPSPILLQGKILENTLKDVAVSVGKTYYWRVITRDSSGNTSDSGISQFTTK